MGSLIAIAIWFFATVGYILNIIQIAQADTITGMVLVRVIGIIVAPLGAIIGWF
jgi:hypothetical protein